MKTSGRSDIQVKHFLKQSVNFVFEHDLLPIDRELLLSVSGGPDSMALMPLAFELQKKRPGLNVRVVYIDHKTREAQARERKFVAHWAQKFGFSFLSEELESWEGDTHNFEARARKQRKKHLAEHAHNAVIFTGHHLDDSYEWYVMQSSRSGQLRPRGIPLKNGRYRRPWLCVQKKQILRFLHAYGLPYLRDPTNFDEGVYERNDVRHQVVSPLKAIYPKLLKNYAHRQNALALLDGVHVHRAEQATVYEWERGTSLIASSWEKRHDPVRVEQLKAIIQKMGPHGRSELGHELYKVLSALRSGGKGPHKLARSVHLYLWGKEIFILRAEDLSFYSHRDKELALMLRKGAQIPDGLPVVILTRKKGSLKAPHPLFPQTCDALRKQDLGWQTPGRSLFSK